MSKRKEYEELFQKMADMTLPKCKQCPLPYSCCSPEYCEMAIRVAKRNGVTLEPTDHPKLPLMSETGCIAPPHLRPLCTLHVCCINSIGCDPNDPKWTKEYFELRAKIERLEYELSQSNVESQAHDMMLPTPKNREQPS